MEHLRQHFLNGNNWSAGRWYAYPVLALLCAGAIAAVLYLWSSLPPESGDQR